MTIIDEIVGMSRRRPTHPALILARSSGADTVVTYEELVRGVAARAEVLRDSGLREAERCGLIARQGAEFVEHALAIMSVGACVVPIPADTPLLRLQFLQGRCGLHHMWCAPAGPLDRLGTGQPVDGAADREFRRLRPGYIRFTSGTTNASKGVVLGHDAILARTAAANAALAVTTDDRILWVLPMVHHFVVSILLYLRYGATVIVPDSSLPESQLGAAMRYRPTLLYAAPYHYAQFCVPQSVKAFGDVRLAISTTAPLTEAVAFRFLDHCGLPLSQALGIIEVGLPVINIVSARAKPLALGKVLPAYDLWLRDESGNPVASDGTPGRVGEICFRGPGLFDAYTSPWSLASRLLSADGFRTGDMGWLDADGDLHMLGRRHARINVAGMKFFAEEVETVLLMHPGVGACRVFPTPHKHLGEIPTADVVPNDSSHPPSADELTQFCRAKLEAFKIPRSFRLVPTISLTSTGKVQRWAPPGYEF